MKDLIAARLGDRAARSCSRSTTSRVDELESEQPRGPLRARGRAASSSSCDVIAGCDGFHGVCRADDPGRACCTVFSREYPFGWLGILAAVAAVERGADLRPPRARLRAAQHALARDQPPLPPVRAGRGPRRLARRADLGGARTSGSALRRLDARPRARSSRRASPPMRSFVVEPMQHGRLFLAGDAAHIVPPTGAKGLNLAVADVRLLGRGARRVVRATATTALLEQLLARLPAPRLARRALLLVDDVDAAPLRGRRPVRRSARSSSQLAYVRRSQRGRDVARRELRRPRRRDVRLTAVAALAAQHDLV